MEEFSSLLEKALKVPEYVDPESKEPATAILESNITIEEIIAVYDMIRASKEFSSSVIQIPGNYIQATDDTDAYYEPDLKTSIKRFMQYRFVDVQDE